MKINEFGVPFIFLTISAVHAHRREDIKRERKEKSEAYTVYQQTKSM